MLFSFGRKIKRPVRIKRVPDSIKTKLSVTGFLSQGHGVVAVAAVGQAATERHVVVQADILFEMVRITRESGPPSGKSVV
jgi:hypothetical protein